jgi:DNA-binding NarL/FixJ family response regulator
MNKIQIAIAEDQVLFAQGLTRLLNQRKDMEVVFHAVNGRELLEKLTNHNVNVILMDLKMPVLDGRETTVQVKKAYPDMCIIALSMYNENAFITDMVEAGANGFLSKDTPIEEVVEAIHEVVKSGYYFNARVSKAMVGELIRTKRVKPVFYQSNLTQREIEILIKICEEKTRQEIAEELFISTRTFDGHREALMQKTGTRSTAGLVLFAIRNGLVNYGMEDSH